MSKTTTLCLSAAFLVAAGAVTFGQTLIDGQKIREWSLRQQPSERQNAEIERHADRLKSQARFGNNVNGVPSRIASTDPSLDPNLVIDDGTRIKFNVNNWFMGDFMGIGSARPVYGTPVEYAGNPDSYDTWGLGNAIYAGDKFYGVKYVSGGGQVISADLYVYNTSDWTLDRTQKLPEQWSSVWDYGAYNPADDTIYVIGYDAYRTPYLSKFNPETGAYTYGPLCVVNPRAMAFAGDGTLYALTYDGNLASVNTEDGSFNNLFRVIDEGLNLYYWSSLAFDYHTGELFWIYTDQNFMTDLRKIDIEAKTIEIVSDLPDFGVYTSWVESPEAPVKAPAVVDELTTTFGAEGSKTGTIRFKAPVKTFDGSALSGKVNAAVTVDGTKVAETELEAGAEHTVADVDFGFSGEHKVVVTLSNEEGAGPDGSIIAYCGPDTPNAAAEVTMIVSNDGNATVKWEAPTAGIHDGYFNGELLTYDVVRYPENIKVADDIKACGFTEILPNTLGRYWYGVTVSCDGIPGAETLSNSIVYGDGYTVPFSQQVGGEDFFNLCTIYDLDGDENGWYETWGSSSCTSGWHEAGYRQDDWMIMPPIQMEPGNYFVETSVMGQSEISTVDWTFGDSQNPESQSVIKTINGLVYEDGIVTYRTYVTVTESGKYYFGYHANAVLDGSVTTPYISVYSLKVESGPSSEAPAAVTDLKIEPMPLGALNVKVSFKAPAKTFGGSTLSQIDKFELCDTEGTHIAWIDGVEPGQAVSTVVENVPAGDTEYFVYAYNNAGRGALASLWSYVGLDLPGMVGYMNYTVTDNRIVDFEWGKPSDVGVRGGYVDPDGVTYNFCRSEYDYTEPFPMDGATGLTERSFRVEECMPGSTFGTQQHMYLYGVQPVNEIGAGVLGYLGVVLGDPVRIPFRESFANGYAQSQVWQSSRVDGVAGWQIVSGSEEIAASDADYGMLLFSPEAYSADGTIMPLIALKDMKSPVLVFDMYHNAGAGAEDYLNIQAQSGNGRYEFVESIDVKAAESGWSQHKVSLAKYNGTNRLFLALVGVGNGPASTFAIDNIRVMDDLEHDIAVTSFKTPSNLDVSEQGEFVVGIQSQGLETIGEFAIDLYADGTKIATAEGTDLLSLEEREIRLSASALALHSGKEVTFEARVNLDSDANELNDMKSATLYVGGNSLPVPENLTGRVEGSEITLSWEDPAEEYSADVTESFEGMESFAITSASSWRWVDADGLVPYGINGLPYPNMDKPRAFMVWAPGELDDFPGKADWSPSVGEKCLAAFAASYITADGGMDFGQQSDDWLISEHVLGGTEVKFQIAKPIADFTESFEFLVSRGGRTPADFEVMGERVTIEGTGWQEYSYTLPEDAQYFAIRYTASGYEGFAMLIDDIRYTAGYGRLDLTGFNVYRNGVLLTANPFDDYVFRADHDSSIDNEYGVSAVYSQGESKMALIQVANGIGSIENDGSDIMIVPGEGCIMVTAPEGMDLSVYDTFGNRVASLRTTGSDRISLEGGIYVARLGGKSFKVAVR